MNGTPPSLLSDDIKEKSPSVPGAHKNIVKVETSLVLTPGPPKNMFPAKRSSNSTPAPEHMSPAKSSPVSTPAPEHMSPAKSSPVSTPAPEHTSPAKSSPVSTPAPENMFLAKSSPVYTPEPKNVFRAKRSSVSSPAPVSEEVNLGKRRRVPVKKLYEGIDHSNGKRRAYTKRFGKCQRCEVSWDSLKQKRSHLKNKAKQCIKLDYVCICSHCKGKFRDEKDVKRHLTSVRISSVQTVTFKCKTCPKVYSLLKDMEEHLRNKNKVGETKIEKEMTSSPGTELPEEDNVKLEVLKVNTHIDDFFRQPFQLYSFQKVQVYSLTNTVMKGNKDPMNLGEVKKRKYSARREKCQYCEETLETLAEKNEHLANQEGCKLLGYFCICKHCNKPFRDEKDVKIHWSMKRTSINCYIEFKCKTCRQVFPSLNDVTVHLSHCSTDPPERKKTKIKLEEDDQERYTKEDPIKPVVLEYSDIKEEEPDEDPLAGY